MRTLLIVFFSIFFCGCHTLFFTKTFHASSLSGNPLPIDKSGWKLTFDDEFNSGKLNDDLWQTWPYYGTRYNSGNPLIWFSDDAVRCTDSTVILSLYEDSITIDTAFRKMAAGWIGNFKAMDQQYGYYEARCKIPEGEGVWPAFWLVSRHVWPPEIDVFEFYGSNDIHVLESNYHWTDKKNHHGMKVVSRKLPEPTKGFHVYGLEWNPNFISWYFDGKLIRKSKRNLDSFIYPMHIVFDISIQNNEKTRNGNLPLPYQFEIDYVRSYEMEKEVAK